MVSQPVSPGIRPPSGIYDQFLFLFHVNYRKIFVEFFYGAPSPMRWRSIIFSTVTPQSEPHRAHNPTSLSHLRLRSPYFIYSRDRVEQLYSQALGSLFIASCSSQRYNGGILTHFHMGGVCSDGIGVWSWICHQRSVSQFILVSGLLLGPMTRF
jgi:hypothetical protein